MKQFNNTLLAFSMIIIPLGASAQQRESALTREQVHEELVQLQQAGYNQFSRDASNTNDLDSVKARIQAQQTRGTLAHGDDQAATSERGATSVSPFQHGTYFGH
jgi:hypothetical protein